MSGKEQGAPRGAKFASPIETTGSLQAVFAGQVPQLAKTCLMERANIGLPYTREHARPSNLTFTKQALRGSSPKG